MEETQEIYESYNQRYKSYLSEWTLLINSSDESKNKDLKKLILQIERDVLRTDSSLFTGPNEYKKEIMKRILITYSFKNTDVGKKTNKTKQNKRKRKEIKKKKEKRKRHVLLKIIKKIFKKIK